MRHNHVLVLFKAQNGAPFNGSSEDHLITAPLMTVGRMGGTGVIIRTLVSSPMHTSSEVCNLTTSYEIIYINKKHHLYNWHMKKFK